MTFQNSVIDKIIKVESQQKNIENVAQLIFDAEIQGKRFFVFGSGHSHMIAEELYVRAGGYAPVVPILEPEVMLHQHPLKSTMVERLSGYAEVLLEQYQVQSGDVIMIVSNSGRNALTIEMAMGAKKRGASVVALTNLNHSKAISSRHESGKRLYELSDVVLDNYGEYGDAGYRVEGSDISVGSTSTILGCYIIQLIVIELTKLYVKNHIEPPLFKSSNLDNADKYNKDLMRKFCIKER